MLPNTPQGELPGVVEAALFEYRKSFRAALQREGAKSIAFYLPGENGDRLKPESLINQARDWNHRKHPSADAAFIAQRRDIQHAVEVAALSGRVLGIRPMFEPADSIRALAQKASKGFISAAEFNEVLSQTKLGDEP